MVSQKSSLRPSLWFEKIMALVATVNLGLVLFDLSYVPWRDFYLRYLPQVTQYDRFKGIEPHRETENYLKTVQELQAQVSQTGLQSPAVAVKLEEVRRLSGEIIDTNPFAAVNKTGTLEKIKNRMRSRTNFSSSHQAFNTFWSQQYLTKYGWDREINYFNTQIRPLIATNYHRQIGENSEFIDSFWLIDLPFIVIFALELFARTFYIRRRHPEFSNFEAILWRWYDLLLLIPFWRWLRIIPVIVRLDKSELINLYPLRQQIHRGIVASFAEELTEIVVVRVINQIQGSIKSGDFTRWLQQNDSIRPYIDINNVNEIEAIANIAIQTTVYKVLPKIQPDIIALLRHSIESVLKQSPLYSNLHNLPGIGQLPHQLSEQLATQITNNAYNAILKAIEDPVGGKLSSQLVEKFTAALGSEFQQKQTLVKVQSLLFDFLEEVKINYVQRLSTEDLELVLQQTRQLRHKAAIVPTVSKTSKL